jgi:uncharacterized protein YbaP (TraB family)
MLFLRTPLFFNCAAALIVSVLLITCSAQADSSVWKVSKGENHIFLGGTVHVLSPADYPLPKEFDQAYTASDVLVFETDMTALEKPAFTQQIMRTLSYRDGSSVTDHLKPKTITALEQFFSLRGMRFQDFHQFKPAMLYIVLLAVELEIMGLNTDGVDEYFNDQALADSKSRMFLETPQQQIDFIASIGTDDPDQLIEYTLRDLNQARGLVKSMIAAWREGDPDGLIDLLIEFMATDYPDHYETLLIRRNNNWLPIITGYFANGDVEFVLVGAGHLVGQAGLLKQHEKSGYTVEQI